MQNHQRGFSVVVPVFNSSGSIRDTLISICDAAKGRSYEVVLIDDCSSDVERLKEILRQFEFVRLIEKEEKSNASVSRNLGIKESKYDFVFLLDSDDCLVQGSVSRRMRLHKEKGSGVVFGNFFSVDGNVTCSSNFMWLEEDIKDFLFLSGGDFRTSTISIYKPFFKSTLFDEKTFKHQDWAFGIKCFESGESLSFDCQPSARIHISGDGRMSGKMNISASSYFLDNYVESRRHVNGFIKKHIDFCFVSKDRKALKYFLCNFCPVSLREFVAFSVFRIAAIGIFFETFCFLASRFRRSGIKKYIKYLIYG